MTDQVSASLTPPKMAQQHAVAAPHLKDPQAKAVGLMCKNIKELPEAMASEIVRGIYNWSLEFAKANTVSANWDCARFRKIFMLKLESLYANLNSASYVQNTRLLKRLLEGEFPPYELAFMSPNQLFPERWAAIVKSKMEKDNYIYNAKPVPMTDEFRCKRCHKRECIYMDKQTRSCDEGMTTYVLCLNCSHHWKM